MRDDAISGDELRSAVEARKELGAEVEQEIVDAFVARIGRRLAGRTADGAHALQQKREHQQEIVLASMALSIPLFALPAVVTGCPASSSSASRSSRSRS